MVDCLIRQVVAKSNALVSIDEELVAFVEHTVVNEDRLIKFNSFRDSQLYRLLPLSLNSHRMVAGDQQASRKAVEVIGPELSDNYSHNGRTFSTNDFMAFSQLAHSDLFLSSRLLVNNGDSRVTTEAVRVFVSAWWGRSFNLFSLAVFNIFARGAFLGPADSAIYMVVRVFSKDMTAT
jgi:hypothetical protein